MANFARDVFNANFFVTVYVLLAFEFVCFDVKNYNIEFSVRCRISSAHCHCVIRQLGHKCSHLLYLYADFHFKMCCISLVYCILAIMWCAILDVYIASCTSPLVIYTCNLKQST